MKDKRKNQNLWNEKFINNITKIAKKHENEKKTKSHSLKKDGKLVFDEIVSANGFLKIQLSM